MTVGVKWFGKRAVEVVGAQEWASHDPTKTWTDGGAVSEAVGSATKDLVTILERLVAENANAGVQEYLTSSEAGLRATPDGEVLIGLRIYNDQAAMIVEIPLRKLLVGALTEMRPMLGVDPQAQMALSACISFGKSLASLGTAQAPQGPPIGHNSGQARGRIT